MIVPDSNSDGSGAVGHLYACFFNYYSPLDLIHILFTFYTIIFHLWHLSAGTYCLLCPPTNKQEWDSSWALCAVVLSVACFQASELVHASLHQGLRSPVSEADEDGGTCTRASSCEPRRQWKGWDFFSARRGQTRDGCLRLMESSTC